MNLPDTLHCRVADFMRDSCAKVSLLIFYKETKTFLQTKQKELILSLW